MRILKAIAKETTASERIVARAINLIIALTSFMVLAVGLFHGNLYDIKIGGMVLLYSCLLQIVLWEDNYKNIK